MHLLLATCPDPYHRIATQQVCRLHLTIVAWNSYEIATAYLLPALTVLRLAERKMGNMRGDRYAGSADQPPKRAKRRGAARRHSGYVCRNAGQAGLCAQCLSGLQPAPAAIAWLHRALRRDYDRRIRAYQ